MTLNSAGGLGGPDQPRAFIGRCVLVSNVPQQLAWMNWGGIGAALQLCPCVCYKAPRAVSLPHHADHAVPRATTTIILDRRCPLLY